MAKKMEVNKCCGCKCHEAKHWLMALSLVLLGAAGLWWTSQFATLLYWLLLLNGLVFIAHKICKCC